MFVVNSLTVDDQLGKRSLQFKITIFGKLTAQKQRDIYNIQVCVKTRLVITQKTATASISIEIENLK